MAPMDTKLGIIYCVISECNCFSFFELSKLVGTSSMHIIVYHYSVALSNVHLANSLRHLPDFTQQYFGRERLC